MCEKSFKSTLFSFEKRFIYSTYAWRSTKGGGKIFFFVLNLCCMKKKLAFKIDNSINLNFLDSESIDIACRPLYSIVYIHTTPRNAGDHYPIIFHTRPTIVSWNLNHFTESMLLNKCKTFWLTDSSPLSALALGITSPLPIFRVSPSCMFSIRWPSLQLCTIIILLKPTGEKKRKLTKTDGCTPYNSKLQSS